MNNTDDRLSRVASALMAYWRTLGPLWTAAGRGVGWAESNKIARAHGYENADAVRAAFRGRVTPRVAWALGF
jgi:hypothetical protein